MDVKSLSYFEIKFTFSFKKCIFVTLFASNPKNSLEQALFQFYFTVLIYLNVRTFRAFYYFHSPKIFQFYHEKISKLAACRCLTLCLFVTFLLMPSLIKAQDTGLFTEVDSLSLTLDSSQQKVVNYLNSLPYNAGIRYVQIADLFSVQEDGYLTTSLLDFDATSRTFIVEDVNHIDSLVTPAASALLNVYWVSFVSAHRAQTQKLYLVR